MTWKLLVAVMLIPYAAAALFTGVMYMQSDLSQVADTDTSSLKAFLNSAGNPQEIAIDSPTAGQVSNTPISTQLSYPNTPFGWLRLLANSISLTGPIWEPWTAPIRFGLFVLALPGLLFLTITAYSALSSFIGGISGLARVT